MAAAAAQEDQAPQAKAGPSLVVQLGLLLGLTAAAAGAGWVSGGMLPTGAPAGAEAPAGGDHAAADSHGEGGEKAEDGHGETAVSETVIPLAGITTNIAAPSDIWMRLELAIVLDEPQPPELADTIHQDLLAFVRTLKLHQIDGPSGFQHFKADLEERAAIRSDGHVRQVLIRTMLVE